MRFILIILIYFNYIYDLILFFKFFLGIKFINLFIGFLFLNISIVGIVDILNFWVNFIFWFMFIFKKFVFLIILFFKVLYIGDSIL